MQCRAVLTRLDALRTGELPTIEESAVEHHLRGCRSCNDSVGDVDGLATAVKSLAVAPVTSCREACCEAAADKFDRVGDVWVAFGGNVIRMIVAAESIDAIRPLYAKRYGRALEPAKLPEALRQQVEAALAGKGVSSPRVDLDESNRLEHDVLQMLTRIPRGEVRTYAWVARQVGRPRAVRAVANVVARNVFPFVVPCHRVVPASGGVGEYAFGSEMKRELLKSEGVDVDELDRLASEHVRFIGSKTTHIFCCPTCRDARRIADRNRVAFRDADEAFESGYRPCRRCQPVAA